MSLRNRRTGRAYSSVGLDQLGPVHFNWMPAPKVVHRKRQSISSRVAKSATRRKIKVTLPPGFSK